MLFRYLLPGIWTEFRGDSDMKSKPIPPPPTRLWLSDHRAEFLPIHPKAMPVILTTDEERDVWMLHAVG